MTNTAELTHLDESILEDECECEVNHVETTCSYKVTHLYTTCIFSELGCWNSTKRLIESNYWNLRFLMTCSKCKRPAEDCWTIRPV